MDFREIITVADAAAEIGAHPAAVFGSARRIGIPILAAGRARLIPRSRLAEIAGELAKRLIEKRRPIG